MKQLFLAIGKLILAIGALIAQIVTFILTIATITFVFYGGWKLGVMVSDWMIGL